MSSALGEFLRARRAALDPGTLGLPTAGRRVPGLRREELALLAGMSPHYYTRLEQGRDHHPSAAVVTSLARALDLDDDSRSYLRSLVDSADMRKTSEEVVRPGLREMVAGLRDRPAVLVGRYRDVLAANDIARVLSPAFTIGRNLVRDTFTNPAARDYWPEWPVIAAGSVAGIRASADPRDPVLHRLVVELSCASGDFRRLWARHDVRERRSGVKRFRIEGTVRSLRYEAFQVSGDPGQRLVLFAGDDDQGRTWSRWSS